MKGLLISVLVLTVSLVGIVEKAAASVYDADIEKSHQ
jgi:hypothetical protein